MEENKQSENQEVENTSPEQVPFISDAEVAELENSIAKEVLPELVLRHPQQILTNKQVQLLLSKKEEDMTETEKGALSLFIIRAKHHNSKPKALSTKERTALKKKRKASRDSRKVNR